jgi:hypothetical protein
VRKYIGASLYDTGQRKSAQRSFWLGSAPENDLT